jgi:nitrogen fixation protein FixH
MKLMGSEAKVDPPEANRRQRQADAREAAQLEARLAAEARQARGKVRLSSIRTQVEEAQALLNRPANLARELFEKLSPRELQVYIFAETIGKNRKGVLLGYPAPADSVREAYELESRPAALAADSE